MANKKHAYRAAARNLHRLLSQITALAAEIGVLDYASFQDTISQSLVERAAEKAVLKNGRVNKSQVALITGLTRLEVSRRLRARNTKRIGLVTGIGRIVDGWRIDHEFQTPKGKPRKLERHGIYASFDSLVRKYGRDIPANAVLTELKRIRAVLVTPSGIRLLAKGPQPGAVRSLAIDKVIELLEQARLLLCRPDAETQAYQHTESIELQFDSTPEMTLATNAAAAHLRAALSGIRNSLERKTVARARAKRLRIQVSIIQVPVSTTSATSKEAGKWQAKT